VQEDSPAGGALLYQARVRSHDHGLGCTHCAGTQEHVRSVACDGLHSDAGGDAVPLRETLWMLLRSLSQNQVVVHRSTHCFRTASNQMARENLETGEGRSNQLLVLEDQLEAAVVRRARNFLDYYIRNVHCRTRKGKMTGGLLANSHDGAAAELPTWGLQAAWCFFFYCSVWKDEVL
jgi:hypothetical protein